MFDQELWVWLLQQSLFVMLARLRRLALLHRFFFRLGMLSRPIFGTLQPDRHSQLLASVCNTCASYTAWAGSADGSQAVPLLPPGPSDGPAISAAQGARHPSWDPPLSHSDGAAHGWAAVGPPAARPPPFSRAAAAGGVRPHGRANGPPQPGFCTRRSQVSGASGQLFLSLTRCCLSNT